MTYALAGKTKGTLVETISKVLHDTLFYAFRAGGQQDKLYRKGHSQRFRGQPPWRA